MISGLVALIGALTGMFGGSIPRVFDLFEKKMSFAQELKIREIEHSNRMEEQSMQLKLAEAQINGKLMESQWEAFVAENKTNMENAIELARIQAIPTGYWLIDLLNAALRPVYFTGVMVLFFLVIVQYMWAAPEVFAAQAATQFWVAVEGTIGFLSGYRAAIKCAGPVR